MSASRTAQDALVELYTRELRLPGLRKAYRELARDAAQSGQDHLAFLAACLATELESRRQHRLAHGVHQARFPALKTLDAFDFTAVPDLPKARVLQLADAGFVKARENVICLGPTGTGKTHTAIALGIAAIQAGWSTFRRSRRSTFR